MTDLEWLARRVHEWSKDDPDHNLRLHKAEALNAEGWTFAHCYSCGYSFDQWLAERTRLQNKPGWEDAPECAEWLCQDADGLWKFTDTQPKAEDGKRYWVAALHWPNEVGAVLGDWRYTLERRPEMANPGADGKCMDGGNCGEGGHCDLCPQLDTSADTSALTNTSALDIQEGGSHYKTCKIQPVEYMHANGLGYCEGAVVKYVTRWKSKNGIEDLRKARHFIDLLIELEEREARQ